MRRSFSIAWEGVRHHKGRTAVVSAGVSFAVLFIFLELGMLGGADGSAVAITDRLRGELVLVSPRFVHLNRSSTLPLARLSFAEGDPGVERALPVYVGMLGYRPRGGELRSRVIVLGVPLDAPGAVTIPELDVAARDALRDGDAIFVDRISQPKLGELSPGTAVELGEKPMRIAGQLALGVGFVADGLVAVSEQGFARLFGGFDLRQVHAGVLELAEGADVDEVAARLRARMPGDTRVITRAELTAMQRTVWVWDTALGNIFAAGALVAFIVGIVVMYQALATDVIQQRAHYATLKALGYEDRELRRIVLEQSLLYAILGAVPALLMALGVYALAASATKMPVHMTGLRLALVTGFTVAMAVISGRLALRKITGADPASLF